MPLQSQVFGHGDIRGFPVFLSLVDLKLAKSAKTIGNIYKSTIFNNVNIIGTNLENKRASFRDMA